MSVVGVATERPHYLILTVWHEAYEPPQISYADPMKSGMSSGLCVVALAALCTSGTVRQWRVHLGRMCSSEKLAPH